MSASDAAPLPRLGEVFFDVRGESRSMRLSWYADTAVAVFSIWQGGTCTGTFRLPIADLPRMVEALKRGPRGASGSRAAGEPPAPAGRRSGLGRGSSGGSPPAGPDGERGPARAAAASYRPPVTGEHAPAPGAARPGYPIDLPADLTGATAHGGGPVGAFREEPPGALPGGRHSTPPPAGAWDYQGDPLAGDYPGEPGVAAATGEALAGGYGGAARSYPDEPPTGPGPAGRAGAGRGGRSRRSQPRAEYPDEPTGVYRSGDFTGGYGMPPGAEYQDGALTGGPGEFGEGPPGSYREEPPGGYREEPRGGYGEEPPGSYREEPPGGYSEEPPGRYREEPPGSYREDPPGEYGEEPLGPYREEPPGGYGEGAGGYGEEPPGGYPGGPPSGGDYLYPGESPARPYVSQPGGGEPEMPDDRGGRDRRRPRGRRQREPSPESFPYGALPDERQSPRGRYPDDI